MVPPTLTLQTWQVALRIGVDPVPHGHGTPTLTQTLTGGCATYLREGLGFRVHPLHRTTRFDSELAQALYITPIASPIYHPYPYSHPLP